jgi:hypothetical protein
MTCRGLWCAGVLLLGVAIAWPGCGTREQPQAAAKDVDPTPGDGVYTVRGRIESLPERNNPRSRLRIHHEHIPAFKRRDGSVNQNRNGQPGMLEMSMEFPLAAGVNISTLVPGDPVEFSFEVKWNSPPPGYELTSIRRLPADTRLDLSGERGAPEGVGDAKQPPTGG